MAAICPRCGSTTTTTYGETTDGIDDAVDFARCGTCGARWYLDPGADPTCTTCGGSGNTGGAAEAVTCDCIGRADGPG